MADAGGGDISNWSMAVEDLADVGDTDGAISLLESLASKVDASDSPAANLELASILSDLANLYSLQGFSLKADDALSRASLIKLSSQHLLSASSGLETVKREPESDELMLPHRISPASASSAHEGGLDDGKTTDVPQNSSREPSNSYSDDDWEATADRTPNGLAGHCIPEVSLLSLEDTKIQTPKRRGRGTFSYKKDNLYSDELLDGPSVASRDESAHQVSESNSKAGHYSTKYGTRHVLVLADFPPCTKMIELEKLFENFKEHGVSVRWVNDTVALAVFRTPSIAHEAYNSLRCPFTVRMLDEDDSLTSSISVRDLDPPRPRPQTSTRTAERLIAQVMGLKSPATIFGSEELRKQEEARRIRMTTRRKMKDEVWGEGDSK